MGKSIANQLQVYLVLSLRVTIDEDFEGVVTLVEKNLQVDFYFLEIHKNLYIHLYLKHTYYHEFCLLFAVFEVG